MKLSASNKLSQNKFEELQSKLAWEKLLYYDFLF